MSKVAGKDIAKIDGHAVGHFDLIQTVDTPELSGVVSGSYYIDGNLIAKIAIAGKKVILNDTAYEMDLWQTNGRSILEEAGYEQHAIDDFMDFTKQ